MSSTPLAITGPLTCWKRRASSRSSVAGDPREEQVGEEVEQLAVEVGPALAGAVDRVADDGAASALDGGPIRRGT